MTAATTVWREPELTAVVRDTEPRPLVAIYGGNPGKEGVDHCQGPPKKIDDCSSN